MSGSLRRKDRREAARAHEKTIRRIQLAEEAGRKDWKAAVDAAVPKWAVAVSMRVLPAWWVAAVGRIVMPLTSSRYMVLAHKRKWGAVRRWINIGMPRLIAWLIHIVTVAPLVRLKWFFRTFGVRTVRKLASGRQLRLRVYAWWFKPVLDKRYPI